MKAIYDKLYQFSTYIPPMDFTIHQYLLATDPAILFAAGTVQQAEQNLPKIKKILSGKELKYIFVSHIESDECGGLSVFQKEYPSVQVICSQLAARELPGYGYYGTLAIGSSKTTLKDGNLELQFFDYPSEVHMQSGLVCYEKNTGIFYSADLMLRFGNGVAKTEDAVWEEEVKSIHLDYIIADGIFDNLKKQLNTIHPVWIAVGHGFCLKCADE